MTSTAGPGISLMGEFTGLGYYAEVPAVIFDVQRVGPSTGLPRDGAAGRPDDRCPFSRRHEAPVAHPRIGQRVLHHGDGRVRSGGAAADARVRDVGPRPRHEHLDVATVRLPHQAARSRQAPRCRGAQAAWRVCPLSRRRWRRHPLPHRARRRHAGVLRARIGPQREGPVQRARRRLRQQPRSAGAQVRNRADAGAKAGGHDGPRRPASA